MARISLAVCAVLVAVINAAPQQPAANQQPEKAEPYEYNYKVEDAEKSVYFGKSEQGNEAGRVEGTYYVWLPDGRLMTVSYYVDKESGYVPKITYQENANPIGQPAPSGRR
uniref:Pro-resilin n=1 Tax=Lygus hesperus TaxID=30085 RepID=A0A0A9WNI3_LYGHE